MRILEIKDPSGMPASKTFGCILHINSQWLCEIKTQKPSYSSTDYVQRRSECSVSTLSLGFGCCAGGSPLSDILLLGGVVLQHPELAQSGLQLLSATLQLLLQLHVEAAQLLVLLADV